MNKTILVSLMKARHDLRNVDYDSPEYKGYEELCDALDDVYSNDKDLYNEARKAYDATRADLQK